MIPLRALAAAVAAAFASHIAGAGESLREALAETKPLIDWRLRYEGVDQAGLPEEAGALTSRLRFGIETGRVAGTSLLAEGVWLANADDHYNDTINGETDYPVVSDPGDTTAINRFAIVNRSLANAVLTFGRQRIVHGNSRFVGNVGWRQLEQTFDGARAELGFGDVKLDLSYATQVNRVFGPDSPVGRWDGDIALVRASRAFKWGTAAAYGYLLDIENAAAMSTDTYGAEIVGSRPLGGRLTARYAASYATQDSAGANPAHYDVDFVWLEGGLGIGKATVDVGRQTLGSDGRNAFATPLATLHLFQGWTDKFLTTPTAGIVDDYAQMSYAFGAAGPFEQLALTAAHHDYDADQGAARYGDEHNVQLTGKVAKMTFTLKYASYGAEALLTDTQKFWMSMDYAF